MLIAIIMKMNALASLMVNIHDGWAYCNHYEKLNALATSQFDKCYFIFTLYQRNLIRGLISYLRIITAWMFTAQEPTCKERVKFSQGPNRGVIPFEPNVVLNREISKTSLKIWPKQRMYIINLMSNYTILVTILIIAHEKYVQLYISSKGLNLFI